MFGLTVPPAAALLVMTRRFVPRDPPRVQTAGRVDVAGALTATLGLLGIVFGLTNASRSGWASAPTLTALIAGTGLLAVFLLIQARIP